MITQAQFDLEPWAIKETRLDRERLAQAESIFALSNGHIGLRGNLDEGEPHGMPGTYLNGFHEVRPLPYAEAGYGYPEAGQTILNVTNGKIIRLLVDDEPFDVRYGELKGHERALDLRAGVLRRVADWVSPANTRVRVTTTRLVSFSQRAVAAIEYVVEPVEQALRVVVQSQLVANEPLPTQPEDPRAAAALEKPLECQAAIARGLAALMAHSTRTSGLLMAAAMDHEIDGPPDTHSWSAAAADEASTTVATDLESGQRLRVVKYFTYGWSSQRSLPAVRDQVWAALAEARHTGWNGLVEAQREYLDDYWGRADVEIEGDTELQVAVRFSMFHCLQSAARAEKRATPAKGLTGPGYDGHTFWDTDTFVLPVLTYTVPSAARDALAWRHSILDLARTRASELGLRGAAFPWRTIAGQECSAYWPAGTAAFHINADVADAVARYQHAVDDPGFERSCGVEILVATARLWRSLGHHDKDGNFRIDGVTGPDEYSAIADNNVYTNLMAQRNLREAADAVVRHPDVASKVGADVEEAASWRDAADNMVIPYDSAMGVHCQSEGFTRHDRWDFDHTPDDHYPLLLHYPYFDLYRKQVVKQADLVQAMHLRGDAFTRRGEAAQLRLLRARHGPGLIALGLHAGGDGRRGRPHGARLRLLRRGGADRPRRPPAQHPRRPSHRVAGRQLDRGGQRVRWPARPRRRAHVQAAPAPRAHAAYVRPLVQGPLCTGRGHPRAGHLQADQRRATGDHPPRRDAHGRRRGAGDATDSRHLAARRAAAAARSRADEARAPAVAGDGRPYVSRGLRR